MRIKNISKMYNIYYNLGTIEEVEIAGIFETASNFHEIKNDKRSITS